MHIANAFINSLLKALFKAEFVFPGNGTNNFCVANTMLDTGVTGFLRL